MYKETKNLLYINKKAQQGLSVKIFYDKKKSFLGFESGYESLSLFWRDIENIRRYTDLKHRLFSFFANFCNDPAELAYIDSLTSIVAQEWIKMYDYLEKVKNV